MSKYSCKSIRVPQPQVMKITYGIHIYCCNQINISSPLGTIKTNENLYACLSHDYLFAPIGNYKSSRDLDLLFIGEFSSGWLSESTDYPFVLFIDYQYFLGLQYNISYSSSFLVSVLSVRLSFMQARSFNCSE